MNDHLHNMLPQEANFLGLNLSGLLALRARCAGDLRKFEENKAQVSPELYKKISEKYRSYLAGLEGEIHLRLSDYEVKLAEATLLCNQMERLREGCTDSIENIEQLYHAGKCSRQEYDSTIADQERLLETLEPKTARHCKEQQDLRRLLDQAQSSEVSTEQAIRAINDMETEFEQAAPAEEKHAGEAETTETSYEKTGPVAAMEEPQPVNPAPDLEPGVSGPGKDRDSREPAQWEANELPDLKEIDYREQLAARNFVKNPAASPPPGGPEQAGIEETALRPGEEDISVPSIDDFPDSEKDEFQPLEDMNGLPGLMEIDWLVEGKEGKGAEAAETVGQEMGFPLSSLLEELAGECLAEMREAPPDGTQDTEPPSEPEEEEQLPEMKGEEEETLFSVIEEETSGMDATSSGGASEKSMKGLKELEDTGLPEDLQPVLPQSGDEEKPQRAEPPPPFLIDETDDEIPAPRLEDIPEPDAGSLFSGLVEKPEKTELRFIEPVIERARENVS